jgi:acetate kinase
LSEGSLGGVGHRVVHGGRHRSVPVVIDQSVIDDITAAGELAPLHNYAAIEAIGAARELLGAKVPMVAVFDTAFHHGMPERASRYAIPPDVADDLGIRRYGFHGLAHRHMAERCGALMGGSPRGLKLITFQLGGGCSAAAVLGGKSVDTSMGFTPLEGLVMGTRSGDIDPSIVRYLCGRFRSMPADIDAWLSERSGLLGISGVSADVRELLKLESEGHARAALALDMFVYRLRKYIGAYLATLGGANAIAFGGGIGENSPEIRERACRGMEWCGLAIDEARNRTTVGTEGEVSSDSSKVRVFVIPVDEESVIASDAARVLTAQSKV